MFDSNKINLHLTDDNYSVVNNVIAHVSKKRHLATII